MKYFMLKLDPAFTHAPNIINWYKVFDVRKLHPETADKVPYRNLLEISPDPAIIFTDIIVFPYLLISVLLKKVLTAYEPLVEYKDVVVLDKINKQYALYYLPILETVDCLHETSQFNLDRSVIKKAVFDPEKTATANKSIFRIGGVKNTYIAVRLDLAESLLRRKAVGVYLEPIEWGEAVHP